MALTDEDREEIAEIAGRVVASQRGRLSPAYVVFIATIVVQMVVTAVTLSWFAGKWKSTTEALQNSLAENRAATQSLSASVSTLAEQVAVLKDRSDRQMERAR